jgi:hypothetical protein
MAVGKGRTRPLVIGGRRFRWRCEFNHPAEKLSVAWAEERIITLDRLFVRPEDGPHRLLTVSWPPCEGPVVKPGLVRACVEAAIRRGWLADVPTMELSGSDMSAGDGARPGVEC